MGPLQRQVFVSVPMFALHYGKSGKPLAHVVPDAKYPNMWRIKWPDGTLSDMVNLSRAKDAAAVIAARRAPELNSRLLHWKQDRHGRVDG